MEEKYEEGKIVSMGDLSKEQLIEMNKELAKRNEKLENDVRFWQESYGKESKRYKSLKQAMEGVLALTSEG